MRRRALLVGINNYSSAPLYGCVNDVLDIHHTIMLLKSRFCIKQDDIRVLTDFRATKENIMHRLRWLVEGMSNGDLAVFQFSGHGSQIRDRDGDELNDNLDEILIPAAVDWDDKGYIMDDELYDIFSRIPDEAMVEVILDCCHSGTGLREINPRDPNSHVLDVDEKIDGSFHARLNRFMHAPADIYLRSGSVPFPVKKILRTRRELNGRMVLWAGCADNQTSADAYIKDRYHGAFSYYFNRLLRDNAKISRKELITILRDALKHEGYPQVPQLECFEERERVTLFQPKY